MIPRSVAEELGQPLPLFIKWDDADYGLRAAEHGYGTVTMPGTAIWHMAWSDKDDAIDWQAYFHLRNRLVVAAMHWDGDIGGLLGSSLKATFKHLLCLEYSTVAIQNRAIADFLAGPEHIFSILESALPEVREMRSAYPDAVVLPGATSLPTPSGRRKVHKPPVSLPAIGFRLARGVVHQLRKEDPAHHQRPQLNVATQDARWFLLSKVDGVTVTTADGRGIVYRQRDRAKMFALLRILDAPARGPGPKVQPDAQGLPRGAAGAVEQAEVGDGPASAANARKCEDERSREDLAVQMSARAMTRRRDESGRRHGYPAG